MIQWIKLAFTMVDSPTVPKEAMPATSLAAGKTPGKEQPQAETNGRNDHDAPQIQPEPARDTETTPTGKQATTIKPVQETYATDNERIKKESVDSTAETRPSREVDIKGREQKRLYDFIENYYKQALEARLYEPGYKPNPYEQSVEAFYKQLRTRVNAIQDTEEFKGKDKDLALGLKEKGLVTEQLKKGITLRDREDRTKQFYNGLFRNEQEVIIALNILETTIIEEALALGKFPTAHGETPEDSDQLKDFTTQRMKFLGFDVRDKHTLETTLKAHTALRKAVFDQYGYDPYTQDWPFTDDKYLPLTLKPESQYPDKPLHKRRLYTNTPAHYNLLRSHIGEIMAAEYRGKSIDIHYPLFDLDTRTKIILQAREQTTADLLKEQVKSILAERQGAKTGVGEIPGMGIGVKDLQKIAENKTNPTSTAEENKQTIAEREASLRLVTMTEEEFNRNNQLYDAIVSNEGKYSLFTAQEALSVAQGEFNAMGDAQGQIDVFATQTNARNQRKRELQESIKEIKVKVSNNNAGQQEQNDLTTSQEELDEIRQEESEMSELRKDLTQSKKALEGARSKVRFLESQKGQLENDVGANIEERHQKKERYQEEKDRLTKEIVDLQSGKPAKKDAAYGESTEKLYRVMTEDFNTILAMITENPEILARLGNSQGGYEELLNLLFHSNANPEQTKNMAFQKRLLSPFELAKQIVDYYRVDVSSIVGNNPLFYQRLDTLRTEVRAEQTKVQNHDPDANPELLKQKTDEYNSAENRQIAEDILGKVLPQIRIHGRAWAMEFMQELLFSRVEDARNNHLIDSTFDTGLTPPRRETNQPQTPPQEPQLGVPGQFTGNQGNNTKKASNTIPQGRFGNDTTIVKEELREIPKDEVNTPETPQQAVKDEIQDEGKEKTMFDSQTPATKQPEKRDERNKDDDDESEATAQTKNTGNKKQEKRIRKLDKKPTEDISLGNTEDQTTIGAEQKSARKPLLTQDQVDALHSQLDEINAQSTVEMNRTVPDEIKQGKQGVLDKIRQRAKQLKAIGNPLRTRVVKTTPLPNKGTLGAAMENKDFIETLNTLETPEAQTDNAQAILKHSINVFRNNNIPIPLSENIPVRIVENYPTNINNKERPVILVYKTNDNREIAVNNRIELQQLALQNPNYTLGRENIIRDKRTNQVVTLQDALNNSGIIQQLSFEVSSQFAELLDRNTVRQSTKITPDLITIAEWELAQYTTSEGKIKIDEITGFT